ncbi:MAG: hypothetical protein PHG96_01585 [Kiritimatiellae bacterium]|nr:hypothetical protein [Kiritimatiellia bacterium]MDD3544033.1 hypothetical protein [Kiritimatiellia bacterium]MDD4024304.1 hypothetical protein [Kiritimatiellia bacterium]
MDIGKGLAVVVSLSVLCGCYSRIQGKQNIHAYYTRNPSGQVPDATVQTESEQQLKFFYYAPSNIFTWWHPLLWHGFNWQILRREALAYQTARSPRRIREDREIFVDVSNSQFMNGTRGIMEQQQDWIYRYIITVINDARRDAGEKREAWNLEDVCEKAVAICDGTASESPNSAEVARQLARLPYAVERAEAPTKYYTVTVSHTEVRWTKEGLKTVTHYNVRVNSEQQLLSPLADIQVRMIRRFSDGVAGTLLASVDETFDISHEKSFLGEDMHQPLLQ